MVTIKSWLSVFFFILAVIPFLYSQTLPWGDNFDDGDMIGWTIVDDEPYVQGPSAWSVYNGVLNQASNIFTTENEYSVFTGTHIIAGNENWTDYYFNVRMTSSDDDGIGMLFRYQDPKNYYRFFIVADPGNHGPFKRLDKQINGTFITLAESNVDIPIPGNFIGKIRVIGDSIYVYEGDNILFATRDNTHSHGKIGLMCYANNGAMFDDVYLGEQDTLFQDKEKEDPDILTADRKLAVRGFTYNIWQNRICTPIQIADLILSLDLDFAGLQECSFQFGQTVADLTNMYLARGSDCALLCKTPFTIINNLPVSGINVWTNIDSQTVSIYNFHIPWDEAGDRAARIMVDELFANDPVPLQLAVGDFNDEQYSTQITILEEHMRYALADLGLAPCQRVTWPAFDFYGSEGAQTIDLILCNKASKGRLIEGEIMNLSPILSDHKPVWGTVEFPAREADVSPKITRVLPFFGIDLIEVWFDQDLEKNSAENEKNYDIDPLDGGNSVSVSDAKFLLGNRRVRLFTSAHQIDRQYRINITNVKDKYLASILVNDSQEYTIRRNLLENPQAELGIQNWQSSGGFMAVGDRENQYPYLGNMFFTGQNLQERSSGSQEVDLTSWAGQIDASRVAAEWNCYFATGYQVLGPIRASRCEPYDEGEMLIDFVDATGTILSQASSKRWDTLFWHPYGETSYLPPGTRKAIIHLISYRKTTNGFSNDACFENAFFSIKILPEPHPYGKNLLVNPSAETGNLDGWQVTGEIEARRNEVQKTRSVSGNYIFTSANSGPATAFQEVDISGYLQTIRDNRFAVRWGGYLRDYRGDNAGEIKISFLDDKDDLVGEASTGEQKVAEWWNYDTETPVPAATRKIQYTIEGTAYWDFLHLYPVTHFQTRINSNDKATAGFEFYQNFPNPFNYATQITFNIKEKTRIDLTIFDVNGRMVRYLGSENLTTGKYRVEWDGTNDAGLVVASGIYFICLKTPHFTQIHRMVFLK